MNCSSVDLKAYALGEYADAAARAHIESCENCREELERLHVVRSALLAVPEEEIPQRIAFVSDKIFEPRWWQRAWQSGPAMGFASAVIIAAAILVHSSVRPAPVVKAGLDTRQIEAQIQERVGAEVAKRIETAVAGAVAKAVADRDAVQVKETARLVNAAERRIQSQRNADFAEMQQVIGYYDKQVARLTVASNEYAIDHRGGGQ